MVCVVKHASSRLFDTCTTIVYVKILGQSFLNKNQWYNIMSLKDIIEAEVI
jgi:hypothetical protein